MNAIESVEVPGLERPVELVVDQWGIPHLFAETVDDAFFAQGFNAARDRLFQIDLWRRRGLGRLAEVFGPAYVEQDRAARLFLYRGDLEAEWNAYGPDARRIVTRFTDGVNAYLDWLAGHPEALPPEFAMLDYEPDRWAPDDVVRIRTNALARDIVSEVARARVVHVADVEADFVRYRLEPEHLPEIPDGTDLDLPADILRVYDLATQEVGFAGDPRQPGIGTPPDDFEGEGSNNWVVAGSRTTTGRPILASDPHRAFATPSLRYIAHLSAPGMDVIGAGEPALPGISLGHNGTIAFGFTVFPADTQDLYVYDLDPSDHGRYRYGDGWERLEVVREDVVVRGGSHRQAELACTRHGPVIYVDSERHKAYVLRSTWGVPGTSAYLGSLDYLGARNWDDFKQALRRWGAPGENHLYADVDGNIGFKAAGFVPRRVGYDGLLPVPGDGRYDWDGMHPDADLPEIFNPAPGFWATANEFNLPADSPRDHHIGYEWADPARRRRIVEVLSGIDKVSLDDSMRLQNDLRSLAALDVLGLLRGLGSNDPTTSLALAMLSGWDGVESAGSAPAALYQVWVSRHLGPAFVAAVLPDEAAKRVDIFDYQGLRIALRDPASWFGSEATQRRDSLLLSTLRDAYAELLMSLGPDPTTWAWGDLHRNEQFHPLGFLDPALDVGPFPVGGSGTTVNAAPYLAGDLVQTIGASFRMVLDVGAWDNSVAINTPGQSGDPRSPHYGDLVDRWRAGEYVPLLYSRAAVEQHAEHRIRLVPPTPPVPGGMTT